MNIVRDRHGELINLVRDICNDDKFKITGQDFRKWAELDGLNFHVFYQRVAIEVQAYIKDYDERHLVDIFLCGVFDEEFNHKSTGLIFKTLYLSAWNDGRLPAGSGQNTLILGAVAVIVACMFDFLKKEAGIGSEGVRVRHSIAEIMAREGAGLPWQG